MFKMLGSRRGISPILATLLLIVIAVSAVIVTYAWVMTFTTTQTQQAGAVLVVENIRFYGEDPTTAKNRTDIVISNTGTADSKIVRVYIGVNSGNLIDVTSSSDLGTGAIVSAGGAVTIKVSWPNGLAVQWESGKTYYFKIAPENGAPFDFTRKAP